VTVDVTIQSSAMEAASEPAEAMMESPSSVVIVAACLSAWLMSLWLCLLWIAYIAFTAVTIPNGDASIGLIFLPLLFVAGALVIGVPCGLAVGVSHRVTRRSTPRRARWTAALAGSVTGGIIGLSANAFGGDLGNAWMAPGVLMFVVTFPMNVVVAGRAVPTRTGCL